MNAAQKKQLADAARQIRNAASTIEEICGEEQDKYDNLSEGAQEGDKGSALQDTINALSEAADKATEAADDLDQL